MARESFVVNGLDLMAGVHWDVDDLQVLEPAPTGENPVVAGRVGSLWFPKVLGPSQVNVSMWVGDPGATRAQVWGWVEQIQAAVWQPGTQLPVVWTLSGGATRSCQAELSSDFAPSRLGSKGYRLKLEFTVPEGAWT